MGRGVGATLGWHWCRGYQLQVQLGPAQHSQAALGGELGWEQVEQSERWLLDALQVQLGPA